MVGLRTRLTSAINCVKRAGRLKIGQFRSFTCGSRLFRQLETRAFYLVANLDTVIDDGVNDEHYVDECRSRYDTVITHGEPLMLFPNVDQRIGCLWTGVTMLPNWTATLQLSYRPRKANL